MQRSRVILSFTLCLMLSAAAIAAQPQYTATDLGALQPTAVINGPIVFGNLNNQPVVWQNGQVRVLQHYGLGGQVNGANAQGESVGFVWYSISGQTPQRVAAFWYPDGQVVLLSGQGETEARDVNMDRVAVGVDLARHVGLRWSPEEPEEVLRGFSATAASAVDAMGRAWGNASNVAAMWDVDGTFYDFVQAGGVQAAPRGANDTIAAGFASAGTTAYAAHFRFPQQITRLPGAEAQGWNCDARGINQEAVTVGSCFRRSSPPVSFAAVWPNATTVQNLGEVSNAPFPLKIASGISDDGHIIGTSSGRGWLLTPQPPAF
jgi:hypothetical protein